MAIDPIVKKETRIILLGTLVASAAMEAVFLILGQWDYTVLLGNLLSGAAGIANFLLMGITVQKSLSRSPEDAAKMMKASQSLRLLGLAVIAILGAVLPCFQLWAVLIPLFFPRIIIIIRSMILKKS